MSTPAKSQRHKILEVQRGGSFAPGAASRKTTHTVSPVLSCHFDCSCKCSHTGEDTGEDLQRSTSTILLQYMFLLTIYILPDLYLVELHGSTQHSGAKIAAAPAQGGNGTYDMRENMKKKVREMGECSGRCCLGSGGDGMYNTEASQEMKGRDGAMARRQKRTQLFCAAQ